MQPESLSSDSTTVSQLQLIVNQFVEERDWERFHHPKNLAMSIAIEAAELMEHFQWTLPSTDGEEPFSHARATATPSHQSNTASHQSNTASHQSNTASNQQAIAPDSPIAQEMADVFAYLLRLASVLGVDLARALELKMAMNRLKYPIGSDFDKILKSRQR
jgi:dCTP diphosphatase